MGPHRPHYQPDPGLWLLEPPRVRLISGQAPTPRPAATQQLASSGPACSRPQLLHRRPTFAHQLRQQAAPLAAEDVGAREAAVPSDDAQVADAALDQVVGGCPAPLPRGEGLAAGAANHGAALHRGGAAWANGARQRDPGTGPGRPGRPQGTEGQVQGPLRSLGRCPPPPAPTPWTFSSCVQGGDCPPSGSGSSTGKG